MAGASRPRGGGSDRPRPIGPRSGRGGPQRRSHVRWRSCRPEPDAVRSGLRRRLASWQPNWHTTPLARLGQEVYSIIYLMRITDRGAGVAPKLEQSGQIENKERVKIERRLGA